MHSEAVARSHERLPAEMPGVLFFLADERQLIARRRGCIRSVSGGSGGVGNLEVW
jgi:hypothetical protein